MDIVRAPGRRFGGWIRAVSWAALGCGVALPAVAQQTAQAPETVAPTTPVRTSEGVQTFDAAYFRTYNPITAYDMVARVPGFEISDGEQLRGFGATAGNVLINGERPSSKTLISDQLKRVPAEEVARVELISGSASNVDVRGQTQLVNVVLKRTHKSSPTTYVAELRDIQYSNRLGWVAQATKTFALGSTADLTIDLQAPNLRGRVNNLETVRDANGAVTEIRDQFGQPNNIGLQGTGTLKWRPTASDTVSLNGQYAPTWNSTNSNSIARGPDGSFHNERPGLSDFSNDYTAELAGDWEHRFSSNLSVKAIALATFSGVDEDDEYDTFTPAGLVNVQTLNRTTKAGERVGRAVLTWRPGSAHTIDIGAEGAFNFRDTDLQIFNDHGAGPVEQVLPVAATRVEELRGEAFITDVWRMTPALTLETGFNFEASRITQSGDASQRREFTYPKPRAILTWQVAPMDQLRFSEVRDISQLDFTQFASTIAVIDNIVLLGNPNLEPEKTWKSRLEWEHRFSQRSAVTVSLFHDAVQDVADLIPISGFDAPGNLGDGTRDGVELRGAAPLSVIGIPNAELRFSGTYQNTSVTDPVTGEKRSFTDEKDWTWNVNFRQQLPKWQAAWGGTLLRWSKYQEFKLQEADLFDRQGERFDLFVETTRFKGLTIRLTASNLAPNPEDRVRTFYVGTRASGTVLRTERRKQKGGPDGTRVLALRVSGAF
ncbi:MAG: outer membrane beta-barrel protein [Alphaproteobacteria bacterium]|nr:outer membrane beta-barrel protein [Alphaproteobacteria bacterium]